MDEWLDEWILGRHRRVMHTCFQARTEINTSPATTYVCGDHAHACTHTNTHPHLHTHSLSLFLTAHQAGKPTVTVVRPFLLSQPRPKPLPMDEPLPPPVKRRPAPPQHEGPTKEELAIQVGCWGGGGCGRSSNH